jgi:hypothetical protein
MAELLSGTVTLLFTDIEDSTRLLERLGDRYREVLGVHRRLLLQGRHGPAHRAWTRAIGEAERLAMPWELANAHHQLGRHLAAGERSPLGLDRAGHLERARSTFQALGCRTDPTGPTGTDGRPT